jgi:hypothetical protein
MIRRGGLSGFVQSARDAPEVVVADDKPAAGVFGIPAVIVGGQVRLVGRILTKDEVKSWLNGYYTNFNQHD